MLKEAIEKIVDLAHPLIWAEGEHTYACYPDGPQELRPRIDEPEVLGVNSLDALVHLIRHPDGFVSDLFVSVESYKSVSVFGPMEKENRWKRKRFYMATATDIPGWEAEKRLPFDQAAVALMTRFQESEDREYALRLLSQITTGAKVTYADNGIASTVVMQKGAALAENVTIRPLVKLRPYRTFQEVEQPEGVFLIRIDERGITFTEADGGMWKLTARNTVKAWLQEQLQDLPQVTVML